MSLEMDQLRVDMVTYRRKCYARAKAKELLERLSKFSEVEKEHVLAYGIENLLSEYEKGLEAQLEYATKSVMELNILDLTPPMIMKKQ